MEEVEEIKELQVLETKNNEKKYFKIFGITVWRLFAYFVIYSVIGFIVETLFGIIKYRYVRK